MGLWIGPNQKTHVQAVVDNCYPPKYGGWGCPRRLIPKSTTTACTIMAISLAPSVSTLLKFPTSLITTWLQIDFLLNLTKLCLGLAIQTASALCILRPKTIFIPRLFFFFLIFKYQLNNFFHLKFVLHLFYMRNY